MAVEGHCGSTRGAGLATLCPCPWARGPGRAPCEWNPDRYPRACSASLREDSAAMQEKMDNGVLGKAREEVISGRSLG